MSSFIADSRTAEPEDRLKLTKASKNATKKMLHFVGKQNILPPAKTGFTVTLLDVLLCINSRFWSRSLFLCRLTRLARVVRTRVDDTIQNFVRQATKSSELRRSRVNFP